MTYCLGILLPNALVLASDSRSNAGVDQIAKVRKLDVFDNPGERVLTILSAGNLAATQSVVSEFRQGFLQGNPLSDLALAPTLFDAARLVGDKLRYILSRDGDHALGHLVGAGQRLFHIPLRHHTRMHHQELMVVVPSRQRLGQQPVDQLLALRRLQNLFHLGVAAATVRKAPVLAQQVEVVVAQCAAKASAQAVQQSQGFQ